jgi:hypothetical protein
LLVLSGFVALASPPHASNSHAALLTATDRRVRTLDTRIQSLLTQGMRRSPTFASLVTAVSQTDVIVYIESARHLPPSLAGRLLLLPHTGGPRYLRVQVEAHRNVDDLISTIGHELQHALEIAGAPDVQDQGGLVRLYKRIGEAGPGEHSYDTEAARIAGRLVRAELAG